MHRSSKMSEVLSLAKVQEQVGDEQIQMNFTQLVATFGYWVVLVFVAIQCAGIPFPGGAVLLAAAVGAILGNLLGYLLGSRGGYRLLQV